MSASILWADLREAIRGSEQNSTEGPIGRAVVLLAVPMVLEMVMESVFAVADVFYVSRLGPEAVATVGLTETLITLVYTIAMGLSIGVTATVSPPRWRAASASRIRRAPRAPRCRRSRWASRSPR